MRILRGVVATVILAAIGVAAPWLLVSLGQLPGFLPVLEQWSTVLMSPDNGRVLLVLVWLAAWIVWAWLVAIIAVEIVSVVRGVRAPRLPAATIAQPLIHVLVMMVVGSIVAAPVSAAAAPEPPTSPTEHTAVTDVAAEAPEAEKIPAVESVTVESGDTLWSLADEHLGDPYRWPELFELNRGREQSTGYSLEDPDAIDVGWTLLLPSTPSPRPQLDAPIPPPDQPVLEEEPTGAEAPSELAQGPVRDQPAQPAAPVAVEPRASSRHETAEISASVDPNDAGTHFAWEVAGLVGAGSVLGVGIAALLARRRREQFRTRRPGRIIALPTREVAPIEMTAQVATGLCARLVDRVDHILRRIDPAVELHALTVARDATIHVHTPDSLADPWIRHKDGWMLPNQVPVEQVGAGVADAPCAFPLLVTIGTDIDDQVVLLNLETVGCLTLAGDDLMRADFLRYLAAELGVNPWSEGARVSCHGPAADAIALAPHRLDANDEEVLSLARQNLRRSQDNHVPAHHGRALQTDEENWPAAVLLTATGTASSHSITELVAGHPHNTGTAVVTSSETDPLLTITSSGRVRGLGMELTAVGLTEDEAAGCAALLTTALDDDTTAPASNELTDVTGNILDEHRADRADTTASAAILPETDQDYLAGTAATADDLAVLAPRIHEPIAHRLLSGDPSLDDDVAAWFSPQCPYPRLSLLGPVAARCYGKPRAKQKAYYTEALAYLALHPHGVTGDQIAEAFGLSIQRARTVISNLRQWVGTNPRTGQPHIPDAKSSPQAQARGIGVYLVEDLLVDTDLFRRLRARALANGPAGIDDLETALQLVNGRPFDQLRPAGWTWLLEGDRIDQHMMCAVGDVAHVVVTHHLHNGDLDAAHQAARIACQADPDSEVARLDMAAIMVETGHSGIARQVLADALDDTADLDLTQRGEQIANRRNWLSG